MVNKIYVWKSNYLRSQLVPSSRSHHRNKLQKVFFRQASRILFILGTGGGNPSDHRQSLGLTPATTTNPTTIPKFHLEPFSKDFPKANVTNPIPKQEGKNPVDDIKNLSVRGFVYVWGLVIGILGNWQYRSRVNESSPWDLIELLYGFWSTSPYFL